MTIAITHTHTHTPTHPHTPHTHTHTHHTHPHTPTPHTHTQLQTIHTQLQTTHTHTYTHTLLQTTHTHTHTHTHAHMHVHTHIHTNNTPMHIHTHRFEMSGSSYGSPGSHLSKSFDSHIVGSPIDATLKSSLQDLLPPSLPDKLDILGPTLKEVDPESDQEEYELCNASTPRYVPKQLPEEGEGSYIEVKRTSQTDSGRGSPGEWHYHVIVT